MLLRLLQMMRNHAILARLTTLAAGLTQKSKSSFQKCARSCPDHPCDLLNSCSSLGGYTVDWPIASTAVVQPGSVTCAH